MLRSLIQIFMNACLLIVFKYTQKDSLMSILGSIFKAREYMSMFST